jgi:hypothetical protein
MHRSSIWSILPNIVPDTNLSDAEDPKTWSGYIQYTILAKHITTFKG